MIANNSVRSSISIIHLAIAIFCFSCFIILLFEEDLNFKSIYNSRYFFTFLNLGVIGIGSFSGFLSWQTVHLQTSKKVSYFVVLCILVFFLTFLSNLSQSDLLGAFAGIFTAATFVFLLAFSKIGQVQNNLENKNDSLDSDFLTLSGNENDSTPIFWTPNRIVSLSSCVFAILLFVSLLTASIPIWVSIIPCVFLIGSIVLWLFPKIGSWIFATISSLTGIGIVVFFIVMMITKPIDMSSDREIKLAVVIFMVISSLFILCIGMAMLLLSKEAQQEWKSNKNTTFKN